MLQRYTAWWLLVTVANPLWRAFRYVAAPLLLCTVSVFALPFLRVGFKPDNLVQLGIAHFLVAALSGLGLAGGTLAVASGTVLAPWVLPSIAALIIVTMFNFLCLQAFMVPFQRWRNERQRWFWQADHP